MKQKKTQVAEPSQCSEEKENEIPQDKITKKEKKNAYKIEKGWQGVEARVCDSSTQETEVGRYLWVPGLPGLLKDPISNKTKRVRKGLSSMPAADASSSHS